MMIRYSRGITRAAALAALLTVSSVSKVDGVQVVSPGELTNAEGNDSSSGNTGSFRVQWLYPASDFESLNGNNMLTGLAFRLDGAETEPVTKNQNLKITISTTSADTLSSNFDSNLPNATEVFDGLVTPTVYEATGSPGGPHPFGTTIEFAPFQYEPGQNLVVEWIDESDQDAVLVFDRSTTTNASTVFNSDPNAIQGSTFGFVPVTQFTFVPEPSTAVSSGLGLMCLLAWRRKKPSVV